uniref:Uncharacterized protein n=1 Tax=Micrurus lemniscatus lemniscatus TaxID=129467 RepID=A0A2D4JC71_MICLE
MASWKQLNVFFFGTIQWWWKELLTQATWFMLAFLCHIVLLNLDRRTALLHCWILVLPLLAFCSSDQKAFSEAFDQYTGNHGWKCSFEQENYKNLLILGGYRRTILTCPELSARTIYKWSSGGKHQ